MGKDFEHDHPGNWKWGIFYFNKKDSRLIVSKQIPMLGWTFNFAHPISFVVLALMIIIPVLWVFFVK
ncbi:DUF5808 domain-containing protein [Pedobacter punctiformis]|uniref:DUF5808 domain-containing protein n=1 Tax=Pedobacter punctiformis TaxID=3004097 RepID=A0ABT4L7P5_9SPHI|nr:DUF5808 domain-containing protein [Pedobacter sp. HCMS5-2]MCZ4243946.1 DUF5808 domain-containing protein [Pedobacter sp. HCMS5-2]